MPAPSDRRYSDSHEWHKLDGDILTLGVSKFAVDELTDVTYVEMKPAGTKFRAGESVGEIESVKATSEVYCAAPGEIVDVNKAVADDPSVLNRDPYTAGWLIKIRVADKSGLDKLMDSATYDKKHPTA